MIRCDMETDRKTLQDKVPCYTKILVVIAGRCFESRWGYHISPVYTGVFRLSAELGPHLAHIIAQTVDF
jgi:hypothetical protein